MTAKAPHIPPQFLQDTSEFLQATLPPDFSAPYSYPSVDGSIQAEWDIFDWTISLTIAPLPADSLPPWSPNSRDSLSDTVPAQQAPLNNALSVELHALHLPTNTVRAQTFRCIAPNTPDDTPYVAFLQAQNYALPLFLENFLLKNPPESELTFQLFEINTATLDLIHPAVHSTTDLWDAHNSAFSHWQQHHKPCTILCLEDTTCRGCYGLPASVNSTNDFIFL